MSLAWPKDVHNHFVIINVSGFRYLIKKRVIARYPKTRLAQIIADEATNGRELYCDRNPFLFPYICDFYRHGVFHLPINTYCWNSIREELLFWGLGLDSLKDCCTIPLSDDLRELDKRKKLQIQFGDFYLVQMKKRNIEGLAISRGPSFFRGYSFLYQPWSSLGSRFYEIFYMLLTVFYSFTFVFECDFAQRVTTRTERNLLECYYGNNSDISPLEVPWNVTLEKAKTAHNWVRVYQMTQPASVFTYIDAVCLVMFALDFAFRFFFYPLFWYFFIVPLHIIDAVSLFLNCAAFYVGHISYYPFWCDEANVPIYFSLEVFRILRLLRLFCVSHKYSWMNVLYLTFKGTVVELFLLVGFLSIGVILFGLAVYIPELDEPNAAIMQAPQGFWYAIVSITTLGYGDFTPVSAAGMAVGSLCCTSGVIFVSLQIPLIANIFGDLYDYADEKTMLKEEREFKQKMDAKLAAVAAAGSGENENNKGATKTRAGGVVSFDERSAKSSKSQS